MNIDFDVDLPLGEFEQRARALSSELLPVLMRANANVYVNNPDLQCKVALRMGTITAIAMERTEGVARAVLAELPPDLRHAYLTGEPDDNPHSTTDNGVAWARFRLLRWYT